jgi:4-hydroxy-tetrahydrodipicolinate synthase
MSNYKINPLINVKNKSLFSGVGVASVTPFDHNGNVDLDAIDKLCEYFFLGGISYVVVQGTTGESSTLNPQEKAIVNQRFVTALKNKLPLILGISSNSTTELCDLISKTDTTGFEAIMSVCPYYNKPSQEGIYQHFKNAVDISPLPILLYNVPGRTSSDISDDTIIKLSSYSKKIIGIKEASGTTNRIANLRKNTHDEFLVISGDDFTMIDAVRAGADGIISVAANAYPSIMNSTYIQLLYENDKSKPQNISKQN